MQRLGGYLIVFSLVSAILTQTNYRLRLLAWMDDLGNTAWLIRGLAVLVGLALVAMGSQAGSQQPATR